MKAPKLTCIISGQSRVTSENYLRSKADRLGKSVEWLLDNYVAKNVCSKLRKGEPLSKITDTVISDSRLADLVRNNSKCREAFTFIDGVYTPDKNKPAPKAPKVVKTIEDTEESVVKTSTLERIVEDIAKKMEPPAPPAKTSDEVLNEMVTEADPF